MEQNSTTITVQTSIQLPIEKIWPLWTSPAHIKLWNAPSANWHTASVENDLSNGGRFLFRMEAKDGSTGFDFGGSYDTIITHQLIEYTLDDGRKTSNRFITNPDRSTTLTETFAPEAGTPLDEQRSFCQAVLNNFKHYAEATAV